MNEEHEYMTRMEFKEFKDGFTTAFYWVAGLLATCVLGSLANIAVAIWWASSLNSTVVNNQDWFKTRYSELVASDHEQQVEIKNLAVTTAKISDYLVLKNPDAKDIIKSSN